MLKMDLKKKNEIEIEVPKEMSGLIRKHYDKYIADDSLNDIESILISVHLIQVKNQKAEVNQRDVKKLFSDLGRKEINFDKRMSDVKKKDFLRNTGENIESSSKGVKELDKILGRHGKSPVIIIKNGQGFSGTKRFEEFLKNEINNEHVLLCDTYIDRKTLYVFSELENNIKSLKILTAKIHHRDEFEDCRERMEKEFNVKIEVKANGKIHDRFIIFGNKCWSIGRSIKHLGNKDTIISEVSEVSHSLKDIFEERWNDS